MTNSLIFLHRISFMIRRRRKGEEEDFYADYLHFTIGLSKRSVSLTKSHIATPLEEYGNVVFIIKLYKEGIVAEYCHPFHLYFFFFFFFFE